MSLPLAHPRRKCGVRAHLACAVGVCWQELYLNDNQIGDAGASALAAALSEGALPKLNQIFIFDNSIGEAGEVQLKAACEARERTLGAEHPSTLSTKYNLANVMQEVGDLAGARRPSEVALKAREAQLGAEHPNTLATKGNLAEIMAKQAEQTRHNTPHRVPQKCSKKCENTGWIFVVLFCQDQSSWSSTAVYDQSLATLAPCGACLGICNAQASTVTSCACISATTMP